MKNIVKMLFSVICVAMLFTSTVFAQETQTEEMVESFLYLTKPYAGDLKHHIDNILTGKSTKEKTYKIPGSVLILWNLVPLRMPGWSEL